jgi:hypothetical protein
MAQPTVTPWEEQNAFVNGYARVFGQNKFQFHQYQPATNCTLAIRGCKKFYHRLAAVKMNDKWGLMNEKRVY